MAEVASKTTSKGRKELATAANKHVTTLESELANTKASHSRFVEVAALSEEDGIKARTDLQNSHARLVEVEQEEKLAREGLSKVREQSAESAKDAKKASSQLTEMSDRAQALEVQAMSLK